jgi:predicted negative regulator of RcsB-dependent stress response
MQEDIYLLTLGLPLITVLLVFGMKYWSAAHKARAEAASAEAYRELAAKSAAAQAENAAALAAMQATLADMKGRLASVETMMKEVG